MRKRKQIKLNLQYGICPRKISVQAQEGGKIDGNKGTIK
jgi:hypothetical protein